MYNNCIAIKEDEGKLMSYLFNTHFDLDSDSDRVFFDVDFRNEQNAIPFRVVGRANFCPSAKKEGFSIDKDFWHAVLDIYLVNGEEPILVSSIPYHNGQGGYHFYFNECEGLLLDEFSYIQQDFTIGYDSYIEKGGTAIEYVPFYIKSIGKVEWLVEQAIQQGAINSSLDLIKSMLGFNKENDDNNNDVGNTDWGQNNNSNSEPPLPGAFSGFNPFA